MHIIGKVPKANQHRTTQSCFTGLSLEIPSELGVFVVASKVRAL